MKSWRLLFLALAAGCATAPSGERLTPSPRQTSAGPAAAAADDDDPSPSEGRSGSLRASAYRRHPLRGFDVRVADALLEGEQADVGARALDALDRDLGDVLDQTPSGRHAFLRSVPIFLGVADPVAPCACYHPSARWLERNGFDPAKAKSVELTNARTFLAWRRQQPSMVLHELAHALHDQVLRPQQPRIEAALEAIRTSGTFDQTLRWSGAVDRHYALSSVDEYFAETSESLLGVNDFFPFVRAELLALDPEGAALVESLWEGEPEPPVTGADLNAAVEAVERLSAALVPGSADGLTGGPLALDRLLSPAFKLVESSGQTLDREALEARSGPFPARPARPIEVTSVQPLGPLHTGVGFRGAEDGVACWGLLERSQGGLRWLRLQVSGPAER
ncbi:MAG: hypothetical protein P8M11_05935 [Planctomycetota bacterium]|nr:hypothetical protein [Planctomycetota bacterium]